MLTEVFDNVFNKRHFYYYMTDALYTYYAERIRVTKKGDEIIEDIKSRKNIDYVDKYISLDLDIDRLADLCNKKKDELVIPILSENKPNKNNRKYNFKGL